MPFPACFYPVGLGKREQGVSGSPLRFCVRYHISVQYTGLVQSYRLLKGDMPTEKGSTSGRRWGFRRFSLTKSGNTSGGSLSKQSSIECASPPPTVDGEVVHPGSPAAGCESMDNTSSKDNEEFETCDDSDFGNLELSGFTSNGESHHNGNNEKYAQSDDEEESM